MAKIMSMAQNLFGAIAKEDWQNLLAKFNGLTDEKLILHLKESEFRFNNRKQNLYNNQRKFSLKLSRANANTNIRNITIF